MDQDIQQTKQELVEKIRENYVSVALGVLVFLVAITLLFRSGNIQNEETDMVDDGNKQEEMMNSYTVQPGDSISSIARDQLGSMEYADLLIEVNNIEDANLVEVGTVLTLPKVDKKEEMTEEGDVNGNGAIEQTETVVPTAAAAQTIEITGDTYTTKKGDFLWDIAKRAYGDGNMYTTIIEANNLRNPDHLEEGTVLKLPRKQTK